MEAVLHSSPTLPVPKVPGVVAKSEASVPLEVKVIAATALVLTYLGTLANCHVHRRALHGWSDRASFCT